jgi:hypothetical protein
VDAINELLQSGQQSGLYITATLPIGTMDQPFRIGTLIQVTGQGFGFSIGQTKVTFRLQAAGGHTVEVLRADMLAGSSDTRLLFIMPPLQAILERMANDYDDQQRCGSGYAQRILHAGRYRSHGRHVRKLAR